MIYMRSTGFRDWVILWGNDLIQADEDGDYMLINHLSVPNINQHLQFQNLPVFNNSICHFFPVISWISAATISWIGSRLELLNMSWRVWFSICSFPKFLVATVSWIASSLSAIKERGWFFCSCEKSEQFHREIEVVLVYSGHFGGHIVFRLLLKVFCNAYRCFFEC